MRSIRLLTALLIVTLVFITGMNHIGPAVEAATPAYAKTPGNSNPLITHKMGADPNALVYNNRLYVYMTGDDYITDSSGNVQENDYGAIRTIHVISSDDMVNWTDHGDVPAAGSDGIASWASNSWAPAIAHKVINGQDKFFLYFANNGSGVGVLTADSPIGPWTDPIGGPLISWSTPGVNGVVWLFDPAVLVDDDGRGYLYFGGGVPSNASQSDYANPRTSRVIALTDDMVHTQGSAQVIDAPFMFENSGIHKYNGKYYYSYCSNFGGNHPPGSPPPGEIAYMVSDNPMGPFTYVKPILKNPGYFFGVGGNNHHTIFEFNNQWYITYHAQTVSNAELGDPKGYRSTHINKLEYDWNGEIIAVQADMQGVAQIKNLNPYVRTEAETIGWQGGIETEAAQSPGSMVSSVNLNVGYINDEDWIGVGNVDFGSTGATSFLANVASPNEGQIEIRLGSVTGPVAGTLDVNPTGGWQTWAVEETSINRITGVHDVYFVFKGPDGYLFNIDYWQFSSDTNEEPEAPAAPANLSATAGNGAVTLSWTASSGADSYAVQRSTASGGPYTTIAANVTTPNYSDTGLTNGTIYYYVVSASNSAGTSANSAQASAEPHSNNNGDGTGEWVVQYRAGDTNASDNQIKPYFNVKNNGTSAANLSDLKLRYYFSKDGSQAMNAWIDWAQIGSSQITTAFTEDYVELGFAAGAGSIQSSGQTGDIQLRMSKADWSNFDESNDYSFDPTKSSYADWDRVTLYHNGTLVWGIEP